jgi:hypothetical protein
MASKKKGRREDILFENNEVAYGTLVQSRNAEKGSARG